MIYLSSTLYGSFILDIAWVGHQAVTGNLSGLETQRVYSSFPLSMDRTSHQGDSKKNGG